MRDDHPKRWRPVLSGRLRQRAMNAVDAISAELELLPAVNIPSSITGATEAASRLTAEVTLSDGRAGCALLHSYLAEFRDGVGPGDTAVALLNQAVEVLSLVPMSASLHSGFTGIAWVIEHLANRNGDTLGEDPNQGVDDALETLLSRSQPVFEFDLMNGGAGLGVYALERLPRPSAVACLQHLVARLEQTANRGEPGTSWLTRLEPSRASNLRTPSACYNLGVAYGIPGIIGLLARIFSAGIAEAPARVLLEGAVKWLLAQRLPTGAVSTFPRWVEPGVEPVPSPLAWCYGDAGVACVLLQAARALGDPTLERVALEIALSTAARVPREAGRIDAGLFRGTAGVAHLFNRMYQATGEPRLAEAARSWFERTLDQARPGEGISGFSVWGVGPNDEPGWIAVPGFLDGAAGIALALLGAATDLEPNWDRVLIASVSPRA